MTFLLKYSRTRVYFELVCLSLSSTPAPLPQCKTYSVFPHAPKSPKPGSKVVRVWWLTLAGSVVVISLQAQRSPMFLKVWSNSGSRAGGSVGLHLPSSPTGSLQSLQTTEVGSRALDWGLKKGTKTGRRGSFNEQFLSASPAPGTSHSASQQP